MHNVKKDLKIKKRHKNYNIFKECCEIYQCINEETKFLHIDINLTNDFYVFWII